MTLATVKALPEGFDDKLRAAFGTNFTTSDAVRTQHGVSETYHATMLPQAVVFATSTADVIACVKLCAEGDVPVIAFGAGTSLEGNFAAVNGGVCVDLTRMNNVLRVSPEDLDCTVEAGVTREELNTYLRDTGLFFPIDPGANASIGGMASTRASGTNAVKYGTMRDNVLSLRAVMADGKEIVTARRARKSSAGYDLTRLLVGSEGTLGIITEVTLKLYGIPETISSAVCAFENLQGAVNTVVESIQLGVPLARVELLDDKQIAAVNSWSRTDYPVQDTLFFEFHGSSGHVQEQIESVRAIASSNGGGEFKWATSTEERNRLWKARHEAYYAALNIRPGAVGWSTDVCVPIGSLADCILETKSDLATCSFPATILGHVGDGNFHVVFVLDPNSSNEWAEAKAVNARLVTRSLAFDGTCTGEHGIGLGKMDALVEELGDAVDIMRKVKEALDPRNIMNPGKIFSRK